MRHELFSEEAVKEGEGRKRSEEGVQPRKGTLVDAHRETHGIKRARPSLSLTALDILDSSMGTYLAGGGATLVALISGA